MSFLIYLSPLVCAFLILWHDFSFSILALGLNFKIEISLLHIIVALLASIRIFELKYPISHGETMSFLTYSGALVRAFLIFWHNVSFS